LRTAVEAALPGFGVDSAGEVHVCKSLQELRSCLYFFEGLLSFAWDPIPFGDRYEKWLKQKRDQMLQGKSIYCLGEMMELPDSDS